MLKQETIAMLARHQDEIVRLACRIERAAARGEDVGGASIMLQSLCRDFQLMLHTAVALGESWELLQKSEQEITSKTVRSSNSLRGLDGS